MAVKRVTNGWYEWHPNSNCWVAWLDMVQVVQVINGVVWATGVSAEMPVKTAKEQGVFVRKIELSE